MRHGLRRQISRNTAKPTMQPACASLLLTVVLHAATIRPSHQQAQCINTTAANLPTSPEETKCATSVSFFGTFLDTQHPLQCRGHLLGWSYCANLTNGSTYLTVWRRRNSSSDILDRLYIEELNGSTVPACPGMVRSSVPFVVEVGDYVGVVVPYGETLPQPAHVCYTCMDCGTLSFVQAVNSTDTATQMEALELNVSELMTDNAILVDFAPVVGILPPSTRPSPASSSSPFHPTVTLVTVVSSGGMETAAIAVSVVCVLVVAVVMLVVVAMLIIMNKRKLLCWEKKRETGGIGNTLYMLTGADGGKVCSGPIYEDPAVTLSHKPKPPELDYEVDPNLWNGTNWAQSYDVVTVAHPASHRKRQSLEENEEQEYRYSRPHPLEGTYAVSGEVAVTTPTYSSPTTHHYHILEQVVKGEHVYKDMSPFREPPVHVNELYAELSKFNITKIPKDEITITGPLGTGHFSFVSRGVWKDAQGVAREVAIKSLACTDPMSKVKFLQEAVIMGQFKHPSVVQLCGSMMEGDTVQLVIEYLHNGDLAKHLQQMKSKPEDLASPRGPTMLLEFCQQVAFGMHYLATKGFIHRDLAARNVLVSQDGVCKIADFGLSRDLASEDYYVSKGGAIPIKWTAPEAIHYKKYSTASDVWSYGCLLYEIWSVGHKPFEFQSNLEVIQKVSSGYRLPPPPGCPRAIYKLMVSCWNPDSVLRPQFREILAILIGHNGTVLSIPDDIVSTGSQATSLGAPLESAVTLYTDLQTMYSVHISS